MNLIKKNYINLQHQYNARVAELVDALDSKSSDLGRAGSIPASSTYLKPIDFQYIVNQ